MHIKKVANTILATIDIDIEPRDYKKKDKTFSFEMSDKDLDSAPRFINLRNPKTKTIMEFEKFKTDYDSTHEDEYGYWYKSISIKDSKGKISKDDSYKLLIINN